MVEILVRASKVYTGSEVLGEGYIYIRDGKIVALGEGPPPEDLTYPTILVGGAGRIAAPGLAVAADTAAYIVRMLRVGVEDRLRLYSGLGLEASLLASLPAIYELHLHGVTSILVEFPSHQLPLELSERVGGLYGLAVPSCWNRVLDEPPSRVIGVVDYDCRSRPGWLLEQTPVYTPALLGKPWSNSISLRKRLGHEVLIKEGYTAEISIFDSSRPPGMLLHKHTLDLDGLYSLGLRVETLISGEDIVVDGGEHLYIVDKHFKEAKNLASRVGV
ncbi:MAG: hypothetical protein F7B20_02175 [Aeropyrum sp.]|nr:hypothetical protein [Aeropyrum sp.]MCE4616164.1 hypothetical protein [Aeropyrum sp.]